MDLEIVLISMVAELRTSSMYLHTLVFVLCYMEVQLCILCLPCGPVLRGKNGDLLLLLRVEVGRLAL